MLKRLKIIIKEWNLRVFGNIHSRLKQDYLCFETAARISDEDPSDTVKLNSMKAAMATLSETRLQQVTMLKQKSSNHWLMEGSSNTSFFHNTIRIRRSNNTISELVDVNGSCITDYDQLRNHVVQYYEDKFNGQELDIDSDLFDFEHDSITVEESLAMASIPSTYEIRQAVFDLGEDSAPGPDGFSACFYRHCWDIIQEDLVKAIIHCWNAGHILNGVNSSLIIFLAKVRGANTLRNFRPIGLSNFFFKIFTEILATILGSLLDKLVSEEQVSFMKGRNIHENISLDSELVNELHIKRKDGNIGLKLDISQAFDTGLRQGDPLSPLIFVLIEDVLSRNITKLFHDKKMSLMVTRGGVSPTHLFFADDIMIFCKGNLKSLQNLVDLLGKYQRASGQTVCRQKSKIYYGGGSPSRCTYLANFLGMSVATFPDRYLGVQIMPVYKWPRKFILQCERAIRNFIWSGDSNISRAVVVAYDKICFPFEEGGLGLTRMSTMNTALLMKLWWKIRHSNKKWAAYLKAKFFGRNGHIKLAGIKSSILPGVRSVYNFVESNTKVLLGDGRNTYLFYDIWYATTSIAEVLNDHTLDNTVRVSDVLIDGQWVIPEVHLQRMLAACLDCANLPRPRGGEDQRVWMPENSGKFSVSSATSLIRQKYPKMDCASLIWRKEIHPVLAAQNWKFLRRVCATFDLIHSRFKIQLANRCCLCGIADESLDHVLFQCTFAARAWNWLSDIFGLRTNKNLLISFKAAKGKSHMIQDLWLLSNCVLKSELWALRNKAVFEQKQPNWNVFYRRVLKRVQDWAISIGLGITTNYLEELYGIIVGLEWAIR
ncbi:uncharacterized protein LOC113316048 [Papaver somniferum]|uniref:uncharacterized protein LOC113316048 n=1 Tax=Papaver somniferum TaxID=3469 RepID=UPI000E6FBB2A|nr:uncharacterized protein LOC113316048 [Papaver somniferum]